MNPFIKSLMDEQGISQKELASILGISSSAVSQWKECSTMSVDTLFALSRLFQITVDELVAEKPVVETPEQKWNRMYNLDGWKWDELIEEKDKALLLQYLEKLCNINSRFFKLLYKKMAGQTASAELEELNIISRNFRADLWKSAYFYDRHFGHPRNELEAWVAGVLNESIGINNESAFVWELQRIYQNIKMISFEQVNETQDNDLLYMWYKALTQEKKDEFLTNCYQQKADDSMLYELIKRGGRIIYAYSDLPQINFDKADLEKFEGEKRTLKKLDKIKKIFFDMYGGYGCISYEQYQVIINESATKKIEMEHTYKKKDPIKYWEFIKQGGI